MIRFKSSRRIIVGIAAALLLLCQAAMVAAACMPGAEQSGASTAQESCHQPPGTTDSGLQKDFCSSDCQSHHAPSESAKAQIHGPADLLPLKVRLDAPAAGMHHVGSRCPLLAHAVSPPLPIVLCRLLN